MFNWRVTQFGSWCYKWWVLMANWTATKQQHWRSWLWNEFRWGASSFLFFWLKTKWFKMSLQADYYKHLSFLTFATTCNITMSQAQGPSLWSLQVFLIVASDEYLATLDEKSRLKELADMERERKKTRRNKNCSK